MLAPALSYPSPPSPWSVRHPPTPSGSSCGRHRRVPSLRNRCGRRRHRRQVRRLAVRAPALARARSSSASPSIEAPASGPPTGPRKPPRPCNPSMRSAALSPVIPSSARSAASFSQRCMKELSRYLRKTGPRTTCLYLLAFIDSQSLSAAFHKVSSKPSGSPFQLRRTIRNALPS